MSKEEDILLTANEVAAYLRVTPKTIRVWIKEGKIPASRMTPRSIRIRKSDLAKFLEQSQVQVQK